MDADYRRNALAPDQHHFEQSLFVLATVMSVPARERAVVDAGLKAFAFDSGPPLVHGATGSTTQRHPTSMACSKSRRRASRRCSAIAWLVPGHCDPTVNLYDWIVGVRGTRVECLWPVAARGALGLTRATLYFASASISSRRRFSCSRELGCELGPESPPPRYTCRISISESPGIGFEQRLTRSIASSFEFTCHSQNPAMNSFVSANGPSITVRFFPEKRTRAPFELGCKPSPASMHSGLHEFAVEFPDVLVS